MRQELQATKINLYRKVLEEGEELYIRACGTSMWPFIKNEDILVIKKVPLTSFSTGDIIAYVQDERVICHRVSERKHKVISTKADALTGVDSRIPTDNILGQVIAREKDGARQSLKGFWPNFKGKLVLNVSYVWAPLIPILRKVKHVFN